MFEVYSGVMPLLILTAGALLYLFVEALPVKSKGSAAIALVTVVGSLIYVVTGFPHFTTPQVIYGSLVMDPISWGFSVLILVALFSSVLLVSDSVRGETGYWDREFYCLMLLSGIGALVFVNAAHLLVLYVGMELMSLSIYPLAASVHGNKASAEAGFKYFVLGAFSSALMLYGIALLYGLTGTLSISGIVSEPILESMGGALALGLLLSGMLFKLGAVPLHFWVPDVYQGAPFPVTAFMASVVKVATVGVLCRLVYALASESLLVWEGFLWVCAVSTMIVGNVCALRQNSLKRMLAFSSVAHAGYMLVGIMANDIFPVVMYYLVGYLFMTLGIFGILIPLSKNSDDISLDALKGFGRINPFWGVCLSLFILGMAGLPPGFVGLFGKIFVFQEAVRTGYVGLVIIACLCSAVGCFYYLRVFAALWLDGTSDGSNQVAGEREALKLGILPQVVVLSSLLITTFVGLMPDSTYNLLVKLFENSML